MNIMTTGSGTPFAAGGAAATCAVADAAAGDVFGALVRLSLQQQSGATGTPSPGPAGCGTEAADAEAAAAEDVVEGAVSPQDGGTPQAGGQPVPALPLVGAVLVTPAAPTAPASTTAPGDPQQLPGDGSAADAPALLVAGQTTEAGSPAGLATGPTTPPAVGTVPQGTATTGETATTAVPSRATAPGGTAEPLAGFTPTGPLEQTAHPATTSARSTEAPPTVGTAPAETTSAAPDLTGALDGTSASHGSSTGSGSGSGQQQAHQPASANLLPVGVIASGPAVTAATPMATEAVPGQAAATTSSQVTDQVFTSVARLVTREDGTQRLTLRLRPEELGEVRVVLTVRDGAVSVSLAADSVAQDALRHGAPELRRLLELAGAGSSQVVVRDLPGSTTTPGSGTSHHGTAVGDGGSGGSGGEAAREHGAGTSRDRHGRLAHAGHDHDVPVPTSTARRPSSTPVPGVDLRM